ncbi:3-hydroxyacyl-CoA dehydrogenase/enoyl-CoA hydratase/dodecenoyl-CoA isomerase protein (plasmid) [Rhizobium etli]|uniref:3-hydroxyacyl-CoA dehydrogenase/enoyl-CoA hydratase/dodecenoyl-CoA isomerase protein n=1 Tax=Rhizobium etli TaxID=29449 RepID=A0AAN1BMB2_RHIET|nr:3-hydroxyacyl-CoA dehydrogenase NAD-binding domain-containing protein [Rhizobium etli]ARQ13824.1 3-hydroxyacyl-CoA dehydrogenase/enoyl-CoA hydratase/dodecenoyl-CoA isomerase protein [Rhizobium etli]
MQIIEKHVGRALVIHFDNPPVNALAVGGGLVQDIERRVARAQTDNSVESIILTGGSSVFSAGADIADFEGAPERIDAIRVLMQTVENSKKPIVAAIGGLCLGGGLELAVAAHYRVASSTAKFAFPEISLGLLPGGGGTQRSPRLAGAAKAIDLMLSGKAISAAEALEIGLIDRVADGDVLDFALAVAATGLAGLARKSGQLPVPADLADAIEEAGHRPRLTDAGQKIIDCVRAIADEDLEAGLKLEADHFGELMLSETSRALRHAFFGRRMVARIPGGTRAGSRPVSRVTVVGGGLMGTGIAIALLNADLAVSVVEPRPDALAKCRAGIDTSLRRDADKGRISSEVSERRLAALSVTQTLDEAVESDLYIEAVFEDMGAKRDVFEALDRVAPPDAILASNTSTLDLDAIAQFTARPASVVGLHFFSPANIMRLLEVVRGAKTAPETLASAMTFAKRIGKTGVVAGVCDGFIGNRVFEEYLRQAWFLLEEGASPQQVDRALEAFGMAMGPCRVMDLAGQDIGWNIRKRRAVEQPGRPYSKVPDLICELGRFGQKTGAGFYQYPDGRTPQIDPLVEDLIVAHSREIHLDRRVIADGEIVERCIFAMINEGAKLVGEGIAYRPVDVDIVYLDGYGFPASRGGPMFYADQIGLSRLLEKMQQFEGGHHGWAWEPAPLILDLAKKNQTFGDLNR